MIDFYENLKVLMGIKMYKINYRNYYQLVGLSKKSKLYIKGNCSIRKFTFIEMDMLGYIKSPVLRSI